MPAAENGCKQEGNHFMNSGVAASVAYARLD
jgi:hypothetical protein